MVGLRAAIIVSVLMVLILGVVGDKRHRLQARHAHIGHHKHCTDNPQMNSYLPPCATTPVPPIESSTTAIVDTTGPLTTEILETTEPVTTEVIDTTKSSTTTKTGTTTDSNTNDTSQPTSLERAHWCRFNNGSYLPLGQSYIDKCILCQCTTSRAIRCARLQCMPTYCIDDSMPFRNSSQCCTQCAYEVPKNACVYNGLSFPHGTVMKSIENEMQCWCQLGNIECRKYIGSLLDGLDFWNDATAIYVIVIILCVVLIFGVLLCCGGTLCFYYYYQRNRQTFLQAYDEYANSGGWQPAVDDEQEVEDLYAEEKRLEAEAQQYENGTDESVPPPYGIYHNTYVPEEVQKQI